MQGGGSAQRSTDRLAIETAKDVYQTLSARGKQEPNVNKSKSAALLALAKTKSNSEAGTGSISRRSFEKLPSGRGVSSNGLF